MVEMKRRADNPMRPQNSNEHASHLRDNSALATSMPSAISAFLLFTRSRVAIINKIELIFKTCNGNVEDFTALQGYGTIATNTHFIATYTKCVMQFHTAGL